MCIPPGQEECRIDLLQMFRTHPRHRRCPEGHLYDRIIQTHVRERTTPDQALPPPVLPPPAPSHPPPHHFVLFDLAPSIPHAHALHLQGQGQCPIAPPSVQRSTFKTRD